jgi:hypothetical protein
MKATKLSIHSEILRLFGALDDHKVREIDQIDPSLNELEITAAYLAGMDDIMGKERLPLVGKTARIYEIVTQDEYTREDEYRPA